MDTSSLQPVLYALLALVVSGAIEVIVFKLIGELTETIEKGIAAVIGIPGGIGIGYLLYVTLIVSLVTP